MISKPKVLILGKLPPPYFGPAIATKILLESKLNEHYNITHVNTKLNQRIDQLGKKSLAKLFLNIRIYRRYFKTIRKIDPDIILIPISQTTLGFVKDAFFILLANPSKRKIVVQLRGSNLQTWLKNASKITNAFVRFNFRRCHSAIVLGDQLKYLFQPYFKDNRIHVLPNGSDYPLANLQPKKRKGKIQLLYFANFLESKGFDLIIEAIKEINLDFEFNAIGKWFDQKYKQYCLQKINQYQLQDYVKIHDAMSGEKKWQFFNQSDVFLFTPREPEGHPWVIVEAMAAGLPIISTNQGAISESVLDQVNGFIVDNENPQSIKDQITLLEKDENLRLQMAKRSKELYLEKFTEAALVNNYHQVFKKILNF